MQSALDALVGSQAKGLSASTVSRLKQSWREEYAAWRARRVDQDRVGVCLGRWDLQRSAR